MAYEDLREYLAALEKAGKLRHVTKEVDKDWELACIARWMYQALPEKERFGLIFDKVKGFKIPVVTAILGASREVYALALGTTPDKIFATWSKALGHPLPPKEVNTGPVKEVIKKGKEVNLHEIPVPIWTPGRDAGPYITAPCVITKDPDTGIQNMGTYRVQVQAKNRTGILINPMQHIAIHYNKYEAQGKPMPICVAFGVDPAVGLCSVNKIPYGIDELAVAGGLRGAPVKTVRAETVDLQVPATAEYVIEGVVKPYEREEEGPFGEYIGYMGIKGKRTFIEVSCITHRKNPIYQGYISQIPPSESTMIRGQAYSSQLYNQLANEVKEPGILDIHFTESSGSWAHVIIKMKPHYPGHSKKVAILASNLLDATTCKIVTVVDEDIDIRDPFSIDWAWCYRVDPTRDITLIENCLAPHFDPSVGVRSGEIPYEERLIGSKLIVDATVKSVYPEISLPPKEYMEKVFKDWKKTGLPPIEMSERTRLLLENHPLRETYVPFK